MSTRLIAAIPLMALVRTAPADPRTFHRNVTSLTLVPLKECQFALKGERARAWKTLSKFVTGA